MSKNKLNADGGSSLDRMVRRLSEFGEQSAGELGQELWLKEGGWRGVPEICPRCKARKRMRIHKPDCFLECPCGQIFYVPARDILPNDADHRQPPGE